MLEELIEEYKESLEIIKSNKQNYNEMISHLNSSPSSTRSDFFELGFSEGITTSEIVSLKVMIKDLERLKKELDKGRE